MALRMRSLEFNKNGCEIGCFFVFKNALYVIVGVA